MKKEKLSNREFAKRFDSVATKYDNMLNPYAVFRRYNEIMKFVKGKCLEVGAGTGRAISNNKIKNNYILLDISLKMCEVSKKKYESNVVCCDAEKLPFANNTFDTIISSESIHYLNHPENFIKEANRVLKNGGVLIFSFANQDMIIYDKIRTMLRLIGLNKTYFDDGIRSFIKFSELKKLLDKYKLRIRISKKIILFPFKSLHYLNLIIEKTFLNYFCIFNFVVADKVSK